ncbi:MAG: hypothetical protein Q4P15_00165 [Propionibacteriaceae bacterium]|nr:hypothetical protein [Propionibacteriaceae bacterium]
MANPDQSPSSGGTDGSTAPFDEVDTTADAGLDIFDDQTRVGSDRDGGLDDFGDGFVSDASDDAWAPAVLSDDTLSPTPQPAFVADDRNDDLAEALAVDDRGWDSPHDGGAQDAADGVKQAAAAAGDRVNKVADSAQDAAAEVKDTAVAAGSDLADSVTEQAGEVAHEVGHQSRRLMDEGMSELQSQAGAGQQRLAELSRSFGGELQAMRSNTDQSGPLTDLVGSAEQMFDDAANWLERSEPADVLDSVRRYASRNPWTFLAISAGVGFVGARIVRGLKKPDDNRQPRAAMDVPAGYHGGNTAAISPIEDPSYAGGARYGAEERVQPSATPATSFAPVGDAGFGGTEGLPPMSDAPGGTRGL